MGICRGFRRAVNQSFTSLQFRALAATVRGSNRTKGYWVVHSDVSDEAKHAEYVKANRAVLGRYGVKFLVCWGTFEQVEGTGRSRQVWIEFPTYAAALNCYHDPEYEREHLLRNDAAKGEMVIVEGLDGPKP
jgi:uncharacterized protein (DUF1330 family)